METQQVPLKAIRTHPALQPRDLSLLKMREQVRQEEQSTVHVRDMARLLEADARAELVPLQVAEVAGVLYVVDGHHRLAAYRQAKRESVPVQVRVMTLREASHASKLANVTHTKLEMRPEQKRNALWHHLAAITQEGKVGLPNGDSQVALAGRFGASRDTVQRMIRRLPEVDPEGYPREHRDAITGWPHWRYVRGSVCNGMYQAMTPDVRARWREDRFLKRLVKLVDKEDRAVVLSALRRWTEEAPEEDRAMREALERGVWLSEGAPEDF